MASRLEIKCFDMWKKENMRCQVGKSKYDNIDFQDIHYFAAQNQMKKTKIIG